MDTEPIPINETTDENTEFVSIEMVATEEKQVRWGLLGTIIWSIVIATAFILTQGIAAAVYVVIEYGDLTLLESEKFIAGLERNGAVLAISTIASCIICCPLILGIAKLKKNSNVKEALGLNAVSPKTYGFWMALILGIIISMDLLTMLLTEPVVPESMVLIYQSLKSPWLFWLAVIVAAPIAEELFFRGFLLPGLSASFLKPTGAVLLTSFLFAIIHLQYDIYGITIVFMAGLLLGVARLKSNSVYVTISMHMLMNLVATIETAIYLS